MLILEYKVEYCLNVDCHYYQVSPTVSSMELHKSNNYEWVTSFSLEFKTYIIYFTISSYILVLRITDTVVKFIYRWYSLSPVYNFRYVFIIMLCEKCAPSPHTQVKCYLFSV